MPADSPQALRAVLAAVLSSPTAAQLAPLLVLVLVPLLVLAAVRGLALASTLRVPLLQSLLAYAAMVFEGLASVLPWPWSSSTQTPDRKKKKKSSGHIRSRAEQIEQVNGHAKTGAWPCVCQCTSRRTLTDCVDSKDDEDDNGYYPGLVNISGTYCFMNSTLQVRRAGGSALQR